MEKKLSVRMLSQPEADAQTYLWELLDPGVDLAVGSEITGTPDYHVLVAGRPQREFVTASPNLHTLVIPWSGLPKPTRELMLEFPRVAVHNLHHNAAQVAELAMALLLAAAKVVVPMDRSLRAHDWSPRYKPNPSVLLEDKRALVLGYGAIGRRVARACRALGMKVEAIRRFLEKTEPGCPDELYPPEALRDRLALADVLVICLPLTEETDGLLSAWELSLLPRGALVVNVGRGPIVDEEALYCLLKERYLSGAGLDVWYHYPDRVESRANTPPSAYPFHELDNVVLSPHRGGAPGERETERKRMRELAEVINKLARCEPAPGRVDLNLGY